MKKIEHKPIGNTEPICSYCSKSFPKMPNRKMKCPSCKNFIYIRTRPSDRKKVIVTEKEANEIELQWKAEYDNNELIKEYNYVKEDFDNIKQQMVKRFGKEPLDNDVFWSVYTKQSLDFAKNNNWGYYRNTRQRMAMLLRRENKLRQALEMFFEVAYLDGNGSVHNFGGRDPKLLGYPPFDVKNALQAPGVLMAIAEISESLRLSEKEIKKEFLRVAQQNCGGLPLPLSPKDVWERDFVNGIYWHYGDEVT
jgi:DNA-directed RNA polymerase subunit RPC12/RpoP